MKELFLRGWSVGLLHLFLIATKIIDPLSALGTGTTTILSWFWGWVGLYYFRGGFSDRWVQIETTILISALFQLAVGAFLFSRIYNGFGSSENVFQTLSTIYMQECRCGIPNSIVRWWAESSQKRFVGLAWYICEIADISVHQIPFVFVCYLISKHDGAWYKLHLKLHKLWPVAILIGALHRIIWDFCTCGHSFCDGPYRGFLQKVNHFDQVLWHFVPCIVFTVSFFLLYQQPKILVKKKKR
mmetsp:Transcript_19221/g.21434  ORF Transcript_19221/g.21434 Transcript_19221/m.21434 type:complete len:242 (+) Transcript_19221:2-727(+)